MNSFEIPQSPNFEHERETTERTYNPPRIDVSEFTPSQQASQDELAPRQNDPTPELGPDWVVRSRVRYLDTLSRMVGLMRDRLGMKVEQDVVKPVAMLNAFGLSTVASCGGHLDGWSNGVPWIDAECDLPGDWDHLDDAQIDIAETRADAMLSKAATLLAEFYSTRSVPHDEMLRLRRFGFGFKLEPNCAGEFNAMPDSERERLLPRLRKEMAELSHFLERRFLSEGTVERTSAQLTSISAGHRASVPVGADIPLKLQTLKYSGNKLADVIALDEITNGGRLRKPLEEGRMDPLRLLINLREDYVRQIGESFGNRREEGSSKWHGDYNRDVLPEIVASIDNLLQQYNVPSLTADEYDYELAGAEGSKFNAMMQALARFAPTDDIKADFLRFVQITGEEWRSENLRSGVSVTELFEDILEENQQEIKQGPSANFSGEMNRMIVEGFPLQNRVITAILNHRSSSS